MKFLGLSSLVGILLLAGCGRSLEQQTREQVQTLANAELPEESVEIVDVQRTGDHAIAEVEIKTAFKMRKEDDRWVVEEVRLGDRRWESVDRIVAALNQERRSDTRLMMEELAGGIARYLDRYGEVPQTENFENLLDLLNPGFVSRVIRLDSWWNAFSYASSDRQSFELRSAGVDGNFGTEDDLVIRKPVQP